MRPLRTAASLLLAVIAAALTVLATAGALVDEAAHRPDTVRGIAERIAADDAVRAAVPRAVSDVVEQSMPTAIPDALTQFAQDLVTPIAEDVAQDPSVAAGFADTADEARRAWLIDLDRARGSSEPVAGGDFRVPFGPVAQSGLTAAVGDVETRLRAGDYDLPGQGVVESVIGVDVGDWAADTLVKPLYDRAAQLRDDSALTVTVQVDPLKSVDRSTVAWWVAASAHWAWAAVAAGLALVAALLLAPHGQRGLALAAAGVVVLAAGLAAGSALGSAHWTLAAPEGASPGMAALARAAQDAFRPALDDVLTPWIQGLSWGGGIALALGLLVLVVELATRGARRRRPARARTGGSTAA